MHTLSYLHIHVLIDHCIDQIVCIPCDWRHWLVLWRWFYDTLNFPQCNAPSKYLVPTWTQEWQSTWSEHNVHMVAFKVRFLAFPSLSWQDSGEVCRDIQDAMHQPQEASVMQARQVVYTEQSELAKGWRNCTPTSYRARKMFTVNFFFFTTVCFPNTSKTLCYGW